MFGLFLAVEAFTRVVVDIVFATTNCRLFRSSNSSTRNSRIDKSRQGNLSAAKTLILGPTQPLSF